MAARRGAKDGVAVRLYFSRVLAPPLAGQLYSKQYFHTAQQLIIGTGRAGGQPITGTLMLVSGWARC